MVKCEEFDAQTSAVHSTFTFFLELGLIVFWSPFAVKFVYQLWKLRERTQLVYSTLTYIFFTALYICAKFWSFGIEPIIQKYDGFWLPGCAFLDYFNKIVDFMVYTILTQIFIHRLEISFKGSNFEIEAWKIRLFHTLNWTAYLYLFIVFTAALIGMDCSFTVRSGVTYGMGLARATYQLCEVPENDLARSAMITVMSNTVIMNAWLTYMFISRLRSISAKSNSVKDRAMELLIEKSYVTAILSVGSFGICVFLTAALGFSAMITLDAALNTVFLYCLFHFGDDFYHNAFQPFARVFNGLVLMKDSSSNESDDYGMDDMNALPARKTVTQLAAVRSESAISATVLSSK